MKRFLLVTVFCVLALATTPVLAIPSIGDLAVDFRTSAWDGADNQHSFTVGDVTASAWGENPLPIGPDCFGLNLGKTNDGLGVRPVQPDEIDALELLRVEFAGGMSLTGAWLTNLFPAPDGGGDGEDGSVELVLFTGGPSPQTLSFTGNSQDGNYYIDFGGPLDVAKAEFVAINTWSFRGDCDTGNDYSVAGFTAPAVPAPGAILLGSLGVGIVGWMRRRRSL